MPDASSLKIGIYKNFRSESRITAGWYYEPAVITITVGSQYKTVVMVLFIAGLPKTISDRLFGIADSMWLLQTYMVLTKSTGGLMIARTTMSCCSPAAACRRMHPYSRTRHQVALDNSAGRTAVTGGGDCAHFISTSARSGDLDPVHIVFN